MSSLCKYKGNVAHVYTIDATTPRWEVPLLLIPSPDLKSLVGLAPTNLVADNGPWREVVPLDASHSIVLTYHVNPFGFSVTRRSDGKVLFNTILEEVDSSKANSFNSLVFKDYYFKISIRVAEDAYLLALEKPIHQPPSCKVSTTSCYFHCFCGRIGGKDRI